MSVTVVNFGEVISVFFLSVLVYLVRRYFNRKNQYRDIDELNGPKTIPILGNAYLFLGSKNNRDLLRISDRLLNKYPPPTRFWMGPFLYYVTTDPDEIEVILNHPAAYQKPYHYSFVSRLVGNGLFTAPAAHWKRMRKLIAPTFNQSILNDFVPVFSEKAVELVENLREHAGKGFFDIFPLVDKCAVDIICETAMGISKDAVEANFNYGHLASRAFEIEFYRIFKVLYYLDVIYKWTALGKEENDIIRKLHEFTDKLIKKRKVEYGEKLQKGPTKKELEGDLETKKRKAFLDLLIERTECAHLTVKDLRDEVTTFIIGGSDTTSSVTSFVIIVLGMFPEVQEKVYKEVMDVVGPDRAIEHYDLSQLKYLDMVVKETIRVFPVSPLIGRKTQSDIKLKTKTLPKGTNVTIPVLHMHRNKKFWSEPFKFDPERFTPEECAKRHPYSYLAFSLGPRNCIGMRFGLMSVKIIISTIIREYLVKTSYKSITDVPLSAKIVLKPAKGYECLLESRKKDDQKTSKMD